MEEARYTKTLDYMRLLYREGKTLDHRIRVFEPDDSGKQVVIICSQAHAGSTEIATELAHELMRVVSWPRPWLWINHALDRPMSVQSSVAEPFQMMLFCEDPDGAIQPYTSYWMPASREWLECLLGQRVDTSLDTWSAIYPASAGRRTPSQDEQLFAHQVEAAPRELEASLLN